MACLKDLKKWLKLYDEKLNRLDVARCLAESNVVKGDLLEILAAWPESATEDRLKSKIALACIELLVPLTWPIEKEDAQMTVNHHRHVPYLRQAQVSYKRAILHHDTGKILRAAVRTALPSIALATEGRTTRDESIIKLLLYFFRNIALTGNAPNLSAENDDGMLNRSATIDAFHRQDVLALLLTISSNIGEDFKTQDTAILEVLFHLLKGIDVEKLFMDQKQLSHHNDNELKALLNQEANMHRGYLKNAPTRHNRFGTMIWVKREGPGRVSTVSGQNALKSGQQTLKQMDQSKKWNKPKQRSRNEEPANDRFDVSTKLSEAARLHIRSFVEEFLDSGFNPLFNHIRRAIEREADRVLESHKQQYFYLVAWFLEAERVRRRHKEEANKRKPDNKIAETFEPDSFGLVSSVLIQEFFVLLNRFMQASLDIKSWQELNAGMKCFTQILMIVHDMAASPLEEDQEIAENIQSRIFYEETTHDRIAAILRGYKDQGLGYLDACTEMSSTFLRMLERYSRENVEMQVRSKRRARKTKQVAPKESGSGGQDSDDENASEMEDVREAERVSKERKFDFVRFSSKFTNQACIDTFLALTKYYNDLSVCQLKRAHRFFYRIAFKQEMAVMLYRLDIIALFYRMIKGPEGLDPKHSMFREWEELVRQVIKKFTKKMEQRPELAIELLFSKIQSTVFFLEYGHEKQTIQSRPKAPAALEVKWSMSIEEQIGVVVAALSEDCMEHLHWITQVLSKLVDERQSWETEAIARRMNSTENEISIDDSARPQLPQAQPSIISAPNEGIRMALFKNARLRLLMSLSKFETIGEHEPDAPWIMPSTVNALELRSLRDVIEKHREEPKMLYGEDDPIPAEDLLRRKPAEKPKRADFDDESSGVGSDDNEDFLFPAGGPTNTVESRESALQKLKNKRRKRRVDTEPLDDETLEARRLARAKHDLERKRAYKSALFVHDSDEESDEDRDKAFYAAEQATRLGQREKVLGALEAGRVEPSRKSNVKRKATEENSSVSGKKHKLSSDASESDGMMTDGDLSSPTREASPGSSSDSDDDTPLSSPLNVDMEKTTSGSISAEETSIPSSQENTGQNLSKLAIDRGTIEEPEENVVSGAARRRPRATVFDDSDDE